MSTARRRSPNPLRRTVLGERAVQLGLGWLVDALRWAPGMLFAGVGGALLSSAWLAGPARVALVHRLERFTGRAEGHPSHPFWALRIDLERLHGGWNWAAVTRAELCTGVDLPGTSSGTVHTTLCGARRARHAPWGILETTELAPDAPIVWPRDERGFPQIEVRFSPGATAWLAARPAGFWPLTGQSEEARNAMPPPGTEIDAFWLEVDRPLEAWIRGWPERSTPGTIVMAFDPDDPEQALPAAVVASARAQRPGWGMAAALGAFGLVAWLAGVGFAMGGVSTPVLALVSIGPLLALPWWSGRFEPVLLWLEPRAGEVGADIARDIEEGLRLPVEVRDPLAFADYERLRWDLAHSYYDHLLGPFGPERPEPPPASADEALAATCAAVAATMATATDDQLLPLLTRLRRDELIDRGQVGLLYLEGARRVALDETRSAGLRQTAASFLWWLSVTPIEPRPGDPAFTTRVALWKMLLDFPPDPAVVNVTRSMLTRVEGAEGR